MRSSKKIENFQECKSQCEIENIFELSSLSKHEILIIGSYV